jgi:predicted transcriptional regulator
MPKKRERLEVIHDILSVMKGTEGIGPTRLLFASNLSPQMFKEYIAELLDKDFIIFKDNKIYCLTEKGYEFLEKYKVLIDVIKGFGL